MEEHGAPAEGLECECCMEDIDAGNYVEYRATAGECVLSWVPSQARACVCAPGLWVGERAV